MTASLSLVLKEQIVTVSVLSKSDSRTYSYQKLKVGNPTV